MTDPWVASRDFNDIAFLKPPSSMGPAQWRPQSPSFSFGSSQRTDWAVGGDKVPGPGYEVPTTIGTAPTAVSYRQPTWNVNFKKKVNFTSVPRSSLGKQVRDQTGSPLASSSAQLTNPHSIFPCVTVSVTL